MNKVIIIFVEGDTDEEFYKRLISIIKSKCNNDFKQFNISKVHIINLEGIGNAQAKAIRLFERLKRNSKIKADYYVFFSYDTDIFKYGKKPAVNWDMVKKAFKRKCKKVYLIAAKEAIEDWFLFNIEGICAYLKLDEKYRNKSYKGIKDLEKLFDAGNKTYIKGHMTKKFIESIDVEKILTSICKDICCLCEEIGFCKDKNFCKKDIYK